MIYQTYQAHADMMWPFRAFARGALPVLNDPQWGLTQLSRVRELAAACDVFSLADMTHKRPEFGISTVISGGVEVAVTEENTHVTPFGTLLHFAKDIKTPQPRVLIVAPMSGHFATLLRDTVRVMLADHDVYITDWHNARNVPLAAGRFGLDEYIEHLMSFWPRCAPDRTVSD